MPQSEVKNPKRVAAGRRNRQLREALSLDARERLRIAALQHRPWEHATGPQTEAGKAQSAKNGAYRQQGERSIRELRREVADVGDLIKSMQHFCSLADADQVSQDATNI